MISINPNKKKKLEIALSLLLMFVIQEHYGFIYGHEIRILSYGLYGVGVACKNRTFG